MSLTICRHRKTDISYFLFLGLSFVCVYGFLFVLVVVFVLFFLFVLFAFLFLVGWFFSTVTIQFFLICAHS